MREQGRDVEVDAQALDMRAQVESITTSREKNDGLVPDFVVRRLVREVLQGVHCRNRGYVLDGYPESYVSAKDLFTFRQAPPQPSDIKDGVKSRASDSDLEPTYNVGNTPGKRKGKQKTTQSLITGTTIVPVCVYKSNNYDKMCQRIA